MKKRLPPRLFLPALFLALLWLSSGSTFGQVFQFTDLLDLPVSVNDEGYALSLNAGLVLSGNTLYGTTQYGGTGGYGSVFAVNLDGTGYTELYSFSSINEPPDYEVTNSDGAAPNGGLAFSAGTLYGTARYGGTNGYGTVFAISTNGSGFVTLYNFSTPVFDGVSFVNTNGDGANPWAGLVVSGNTLYGTANGGGTGGVGTVFSLRTDGTGFDTVAAFDQLTNAPENPDTFVNTNGAEPVTPLVFANGALYGTTLIGGPSQGGTVYSVPAAGGAITVLHAFTRFIDGYSPGALTLSANLLYGTIDEFQNGLGTVFGIDTNGGEFLVYGVTNAVGGLVISSNAIFGVTDYNGAGGEGCVYAVNTDGTGYTSLYDFSPLYYPPNYPSTNLDGAIPNGLLLFGNVLYGTTTQGGGTGNGTVFSLDIGTFRSHTFVYHPSLSISLTGGQVVLTWPTNDPTFNLQSSSDAAASVWSPVLPGQVVVNGRYAVTNTVGSGSVFYRLSQ